MISEKPIILIITSGFSPVPATKGGAVENLTTILLDSNEKYRKYYFTICGIYDNSTDISEYKNSNFIRIRVGKVEKTIERIVNKIGRLIHCELYVNFYNRKLLKKLKKDDIRADLILFENSMDLFKDVSELFPNSKYLLHLHNDLNSVSKSIEMAKYIAERADKIIFVSDFLKERFIKITNCYKEKCRTLYNCMNMSRGIEEVTDIEVKKTAKKYKIDLNKKTFLYVGRLNEEKGILELAKAFAKLCDENAQLVICGGTWANEFRHNKYLQKIYSAIENVKSNVVFTGYLDSESTKILYRLSDAVVIPSICNEAFGMVILEAAFYKKPIIASKSGGMVEIVPKNTVHFVCNDRKKIIDELVNEMKMFLKDENQYLKMVEQCFNYVVECNKFNREHYYENFCQIANEVYP